MILQKRFLKTIAVCELLVFLLIFSADNAKAQLPNGSIANVDYINFLEANLAAENQLEVDTANPDLDVNLHLEIFVVNSDDGESHFDPAIFDPSLLTVNSYLKNIGIQFTAGDVHEVKEYPYAKINHRDSTREMEVKYAVPRTINIFVVDSIILNKVSYFGYAHFPNDTVRNSLFICKEEVSGNTLSALLGTYFGLMRTSETAGGAEFESRNLCATTGDYICDTHGDGGVYQLVDENCLYKGFSADPSGFPYTPSVANVMSDSPDACRCVFTFQQYRRMKYYYLNYREYLR